MVRHACHCVSEVAGSHYSSLKEPETLMGQVGDHSGAPKPAHGPHLESKRKAFAGRPEFSEAVITASLSTSRPKQHDAELRNVVQPCAPTGNLWLLYAGQVFGIGDGTRIPFGIFASVATMPTAHCRLW